jgi:hypothetical protein
MRDSVEYPVFDALGLWQPSKYSTFEVSLTIHSHSAEDRLVALCRERKIGVEDWSTVRIICAECSRGNLDPHECKNRRDDAQRPYALAAQSEDDVRMLLTAWVAEDETREYGAIDLRVQGAYSSDPSRGSR